MDDMDLIAPGHHLECLGGFLGVPWIILETIGFILRRLGHLTLNQSRSEGNLDCQGHLLKNSGQIFEDVS